MTLLRLLSISALIGFAALFAFSPIGTSQDLTIPGWAVGDAGSGSDDGGYLFCGDMDKDIVVKTVTVCGYGASPAEAAANAEALLNGIHGFAANSPESKCNDMHCDKETDCLFGYWREVGGPAFPQIWTAPQFSWDIGLYKVCVTAKLLTRWMCEDC